MLRALMYETPMVLLSNFFVFLSVSLSLSSFSLSLPLHEIISIFVIPNSSSLSFLHFLRISDCQNTNRIFIFIQNSLTMSLFVFFFSLCATLWSPSHSWPMSLNISLSVSFSHSSLYHFWSLSRSLTPSLYLRHSWSLSQSHTPSLFLRHSWSLSRSHSCHLCVTLSDSHSFSLSLRVSRSQACYSLSLCFLFLTLCLTLLSHSLSHSFRKVPILSLFLIFFLTFSKSLLFSCVSSPHFSLSAFLLHPPYQIVSLSVLSVECIALDIYREHVCLCLSFFPVLSVSLFVSPSTSLFSVSLSILVSQFSKSSLSLFLSNIFLLSHNLFLPSFLFSLSLSLSSFHTHHLNPSRSQEDGFCQFIASRQTKYCKRSYLFTLHFTLIFFYYNSLIFQNVWYCFSVSTCSPKTRFFPPKCKKSNLHEMSLQRLVIALSE